MPWPTINGTRYDFSTVDIRVDRGPMSPGEAVNVLLNVQRVLESFGVTDMSRHVGRLAHEFHKGVWVVNEGSSYWREQGRNDGYYACLQDLGMVPREKR